MKSVSLPVSMPPGIPRKYFTWQYLGELMEMQAFNYLHKLGWNLSWMSDGIFTTYGAALKAELRELSQRRD